MAFLKGDDDTQRFGGGGGSRVITCFTCGQPGHRAAECPSGPRSGGGNRGRGMMNKKEDDEIPSSVRCPLCKALFHDAVIVSCCGDTFCDLCITSALKKNNLRCPSCMETLSLSFQVFPNSRIRDLVDEYKRTKQEAAASVAASSSQPLPPSAQPTSPTAGEEAPRALPPVPTKMESPLSGIVAARSAPTKVRDPSQAVDGPVASHCDPSLYKIRICRNWESLGECIYEEKCCFAHGPEELKPEPEAAESSRKRYREAGDAGPASKRHRGGGGAGGDNTMMAGNKMLTREEFEVLKLQAHHLGRIQQQQQPGWPAGLNMMQLHGMQGMQGMQGLQGMQQMQGVQGMPGMQGMTGMPLGIPPQLGRGPMTRGNVILRGPSQAPAGPPRTYQGAYATKSFTYVAQDNCPGIIYFLGENRRLGEWRNPVDSKELRVCASSLTSGNLSMTVGDQNNHIVFQSDDIPYSWVIFDFGERSVRPNQYILAHRGCDGYYVRSWQLEGSTDNQRWNVLSRHDNDDRLNTNNAVAAWPIQARAFYRYLRIVLDPYCNSNGTSHLVFNCFEVFGDLKMPAPQPQQGMPGMMPPVEY